MLSAEDHGSSAPEARIVASLGFLLPVALTSARWPLALIIDVGVVLVIARLLGVPAVKVIRRLTVLVPVAVFALALPIIGTGDRTSVAGVSLSVDGLWSAWGVAVKAFIGVAASVLLTATTPTPHLLLGLQRLRFPALMVSIAALMLRYVELLTGDIARMRTAMTARGHDPRWFWQTRPLATAAGATFVRSFERGERVHAAMLARGFAGSLPELGPRRADRRDWLVASVTPLIGFGALVLGWYLASAGR